MGRWCDMRHPAICTLYSISPERGGLFFLHAYHPAAQTLRQRFIDLRGALLAESLMWRLLVQLVSGVHYAHVRGIPVRNISISHVLLTSSTMARISGVGIVDVLEADSRKNASDLMQEDMVKLGYTLLSLASRTSCTSKNAEQAAQILQKSYSHDLYSAINVLLQGKTNTTQFIRAISEKVQDELDSSFAATDALHSHLRSEYENGRMMRLMLKLNLVTERPEFASAPQWSETGDRYVLKLFRDYVYHQNNEDGKPVLDAGHMISALNKLDCGDSEQILLSSRNNKDLLVVSFADVRRCLESAVDELTHMSAHGQGQGQGQGQSYGTSHQQHHGQYQYMLSQQMQQQQQQQQGYQQYTGGYMQHGSGGGGRGGGIDPRQRGSGRGGY